MAERAFYVVAYDIVADKRRAKVARALEAIGDRVQGSVFEAYLTQVELDRLLKKLGKLLNAEEDSLRAYLLCGACRTKVRTVGRAEVTPPPGLRVV